ncbi:MAG TPA: hypothetical protein VLZ50_16265 [Terracidiphilus sp.]|nr:hypothetical protein [Terracidiphilus sp.]
MTAETSPVYLEQLAERFAKAFAAFVEAVRAAIEQAAADPAMGALPGLVNWQTDALPRLEQENTAIQNGLARSLIGETGTIAQLARDQLGLAKRLDGFPLDFAGADQANQLDQLETAVVVAAYRLLQYSGNL